VSGPVDLSHLRRRLRERAAEDAGGRAASTAVGPGALAAERAPAPVGHDGLIVCERLARRFTSGANPDREALPCPATPAPVPGVLAAKLAALDPWQRRAVEHDGPALVAAQAGSGKTTVLAQKALWLHLARGVPLERIVVLTFTERAALQITHALAALGLGGRHRRVGTFHAVARALLARELPLEETGYTRTFQIQGPFERAALLDEIIDREGLVIRHRRRAAQRLEEMGRGPPPQRGRRDDLARLAALAREEGRRTGSMSFDELLELASALVRRAGLRPAPAWVLVDELQDCSARELDFVLALVETGAVPFAVGDPAQSIYGWRGGAAEPLFALVAKSAAALELPVSYRASASIVELARALLPRHRAATLSAHQPPGPLPRLVRVHDAVGEAVHVVGRIHALRARAQVAWTDVAVLARTRRALESIRDLLERSAIPTTMPVRLDPRDLPAPYWVMRALRAGLADDAASARYVLEHPEYGVVAPRSLPVGAPSLEELDRRVRALPTPRSEARRAGRERALARLDALRALAAVLDGLGGVDAEALAGRLALELDLARALGPTRGAHARDLAQAQGWLAHACRRACVERSAGASWSLALAGATSDATLEAFAPDDQDHGVRLLTMHGAKGLEWPVVFVVGVNDGLVPLAGADRGDTLDEERRLLYVAVTRARRDLELVWHASPEHERIAAAPSRFVAGIPEALLAAHGPLSDSPPSAPPPPRVQAAALPTWCAGARVVHARYGPGEVVSADDRKVVVRFGGYGEKTLLAVASGLEAAP